MLKVGFIGWRGMVGSVLMSRMLEEDDFSKIKPVFFSTSNVGKEIPLKPEYINKLQQINSYVVASCLLDAYDINELLKLDCIVATCGSEYTLKILPKLRNAGFNGYWLDASSSLRLQDDTIIALDPVNYVQIKRGLQNGIKNFVGSNCSVSCMLMAISGLVQNNLVEWISTMTYQAASGAGASSIRELFAQSGVLYNEVVGSLALQGLNYKDCDILALTEKISQVLQRGNLPQEFFKAPLSGNLLPWIDVAVDNGQTKEEWKGGVETNKILGKNGANWVKVDGICVRVGTFRCHSQALTIKLTEPELTIDEIIAIIMSGNQWVNIVPNKKEDVLQHLTPVAISNSLKIAVGRIRKLNIGPEYLSLFTVGDQLLWGAAEPLRRMLNILVDFTTTH